MFLNLKNKKIIQNITAQQNKTNQNIKSFRQDTLLRQSKEKEPKSFRHNVNNSKKQTGSTAISTIQQQNISFNNNSNKRQDNQKQCFYIPFDTLNRSQQKLDSQRMQRITSAYRKLKKHDTIQMKKVEDDGKCEQKNIKIVSHRGHNKKQIISNLMTTYMNVTQPNEQINCFVNDSQSFNLQYILEIFQGKIHQRMKNRCQSHRQLKPGVSLQKKKKEKKGSNNILIHESLQFQKKQSIEQGISSFLEMTNTAMKYMDDFKSSPILNTLKIIFKNIQQHFLHIIQLFSKDISQSMAVFQQKIQNINDKQKIWQAHSKQLNSALLRQIQKNKKLSLLFLECNQKNLYSTAFLSQISHHFDIDTHLQQKIIKQAIKNNIISQNSFIQHNPMEHSFVNQQKIPQFTNYVQQCSFSKALKFRKSK